eukprot:1159328-Pelagomonas_calceolata.AAC.1
MHRRTASEHGRRAGICLSSWVLQGVGEGGKARMEATRFLGDCACMAAGTKVYMRGLHEYMRGAGAHECMRGDCERMAAGA